MQGRIGQKHRKRTLNSTTTEAEHFMLLWHSTSYTLFIQKKYKNKHAAQWAEMNISGQNKISFSRIDRLGWGYA